jgi:HsdM N-terminal domain/N-6 DNA Methylase
MATQASPNSISQLESHLWEPANILRGPVDAADFKTYVFPLLFFKRISDIHDEEYQAALAEAGGDEEYARFPQNYRFQVPEDCHWRDVRAVTSSVGQALQKAMRGIEKANPETLYGIFGDAQSTNKDRLSDALLKDLIEHFLRISLGNQAAESDILGQSYEYLIKKFADDSGHTAAEFYTNRTVVHLMTEILDVQPGESVYDPTCGSGGMLLSCITHLRCQGNEWRNVRLYGQERSRRDRASRIVRTATSRHATKCGCTRRTCRERWKLPSGVGRCRARLVEFPGRGSSTLWVVLAVGMAKLKVMAPLVIWSVGVLAVLCASAVIPRLEAAITTPSPANALVLPPASAFCIAMPALIAPMGMDRFPDQASLWEVALSTKACPALSRSAWLLT